MACLLRTLPSSGVCISRAVVQTVPRASVRLLSSASSSTSAGQSIRVGFLGAGAVNFGGAEGPWDHASRVEQLSSTYGVDVVGVCDPLVEKAQQQIDNRSKGQFGSIYSGCQAVPCLDALLETKPDAVFIGLPPVAHGGLNAPANTELVLAEAGIHAFVEKPVSLLPGDEVLAVGHKLEEIQKQQPGLVVSVGYMFRYSAAVNAMKQFIAEQCAGKPIVFLGRYNSAYAAIDHPFWWDKQRSGGPIVEQATHFVDLSRYLGGEAEMDTVQAHAIHANEMKLDRIPTVVDESKIEPHNRLPRATSAHWRLASGGLASLNHALLMQGEHYDASIDVWSDGLRLSLINPYALGGKPAQVIVRKGASDEDEVLTFHNDDPYHTEVDTFFKAITTGQPSLVKSTFLDAARSHVLAYRITEESSA